MKVALIGDVHANLPALEVVLDHARAHGAEAIWNIGDFVGYGPFPNEVIERLRAADAASIAGNYDTAVIKFGQGAKRQRNAAKALAHRWAHETLSKENLAYLASLPQDMRFEIEGQRILLAHGSPASPDEHLTPDTPQQRLDELAGLAQADIVIVGHSHVPFVRAANGVWFVNTGSVGRPDDGDPRACYAMMSVTAHKLRVRHYRLEYDMRRTVEAMRQNGLPEAFVRMIEQGRALEETRTANDQRPEINAANLQVADESKDPRLANVLQLARTCNYEQGHTHQVTRLALTLFDDLQPLHKLGDRERFWLHCAGLLHDIGWIEGRKAHHKTALRLILESPLLTLTGRQRRIVGCVARYHRRATPKNKHAPYGELDPHDRDVVRTLSAILRVADSLDVLHEDRVEEVTAKVAPDEIVLHCKAAAPHRRGTTPGPQQGRSVRRSVQTETRDSMASRISRTKQNVLAFMDIGTNSVRLLIGRINPNGTFATLMQQKETVRLGEGEFSQQRLRPRAMQRAVFVCSRFAAMARSWGAREIIAVATAATREARNRRQFVKRLQEDADIEVHVVSGKEEARLIHLGVSSGMNLGRRQALFIDIGGGSTEVIVGDQHQYRYLDTLKLGAIRLATQFFKPDFKGAVQRSRYKEIQRYVRNAAIHVLQNISRYDLDVAVGSSGTIMNLAAVAARRTGGRDARKADRLRRDDLDEVVEMLCSLSLTERRKVSGLNADRADIIIPGAAIIHTFMHDLDLDEIQVSDRGLREGLPLDHLARGEHARLLQTMNFRERSVLQLGHACDFDEPHARNVARLALALFDTAKDSGLHDLGNWPRDLLEYAALLHDIGVFLSFGDHEVHSAYFIHHAELLGFDDREIDIIAAATMFHRRSMPRKKHPALVGLDPASQHIVRVLSVLLRLAETLDRTHMGLVHDVSLRREGKDQAVLAIHCRQDCQLEMWGLQNHRKIFKRIFGRELIVEQLATKGRQTARVPG